MKLQAAWTHRVRLSANGANASMKAACRACRTSRGEAGRALFPPAVIVEIKALACELPYELGIPLSRFSIAELRHEAINRGIVAKISGTTIWRWLTEDAIKPWRHRSWIFPRDLHFEVKAGRVLDLYEGVWENRPIGEKEFVISADEKTSIQARKRKQQTLAPGPNRLMLVEHEYERKGAWAYLAAWDVRRAKVFGRCELKSGIAPFDRLVGQVMSQEPYYSADRVFWVVDNGSSHRGEKACLRLKKQWPTIELVHLPVHASWLNQIEIYFSVVQRKVLTPCDFKSLYELEDRLLGFQEHYQAIASPFEWRFTKADLVKMLNKMNYAANDKLLVCA